MISAALPGVDEVTAAKLDLWGDAARAQPNGASYEFFENLLPPPRYVNADFKFYPIVLSAPNARIKARLISNGSGVNLRGGTRSWNEPGVPMIFRVGPDEFRFGDILNRVEHPTLAEGYLPIPSVRYSHGWEVYQLEAFAATEAALADKGVVFVKFTLPSGTNGIITVQADARAVKFVDGRVLDEMGRTILYCDHAWTWERQRLHAKLYATNFATIAIPTVAGTNEDLFPPSKTAGANSAFPEIDYAAARKHCIDAWRKIIDEGMRLETPEPLVNNAWRNLIIQDFSLILGDRMNYSAGNQYEKMYAAESSDAALPLMRFGYETDMKRLLPVILDLVDKRLPHHFAAHKLDDICRIYWQTRDAEFVKEMRPRWQKQLDLVLDDRSSENGLLNKENYCTDIEVPVYSFTADAQCWAALRDIVPVLEELGDRAGASRVREVAAQFKKDILAAVEKNTRREIDPPFIPMALFYPEDTHDPITETRLGSYWDLVANYIIGSRLFARTDRELWIPRYFEQHGGLCMGLTRSAATNHTFWTGKHRTNPLYGMRYILDCLRRDDVDRALVSFYGMLAHGMTRNTFIGAEGCSIQPLDEGGRFFFCPPNSASNGQWLAVLRALLLQDLDIDEDGLPDTLRLCFGTPRRWLEDGKRILLERAPSAFGPLSLKMESHLGAGEVIATVELPARNKAWKTFLRARVPEGWQVTAARIGDKRVPVDAQGTIDLTEAGAHVVVRFEVKPQISGRNNSK